jgi:HlyD family secretion protein
MRIAPSLLLLLALAAPEAARAADAAPTPGQIVKPPSVTVVPAATGTLAETVVVSGTLVPRDEVLVSPEVEGLRVLELLVDEGARVTRGQVLARLSRDQIDIALGQNSAQRQRVLAAIEQAKAQIAEADASLEQARSSFERAQALVKQKVMSEEIFDQREAQLRVSTARANAARHQLSSAEAELALNRAQRDDLDWRASRTEVRAPVDGIVSRRDARIGALAAGSAQPMFRIISGGEVELEADVSEVTLSRLKVGLGAMVTPVGRIQALNGTVRLVAPEVSRQTRLGRVRITLPAAEGLTIGAFARAVVEVARQDGVLVPVSTVHYGPSGPTVQVVKGDTVETRAVAIGLRGDEQVQVVSGLAPGEMLVRIAGTFLRNGDRVTAIPMP